MAVREETRKTVRISASDPIYGAIVDFLVEEAYLLDDDKQAEWAERLADDVQYYSLTRKTVYRSQGTGIEKRGEFSDNKQTLLMRVRRNLEVPSAFDRDPPPRICRLVGNFMVHSTEDANEYAVRSRIALYRNRFDDTTYDMITANRDDIVRFTPEGLKLAKRVITLDIARPGALFVNVLM